MPRRALKSCTGSPDCPELVANGRCDEHKQQAERQRGTRQQRGYDREHERIRASWRPRVELGQVDCHAIDCLMPNRRIDFDAAWDLGHTADRSGWTGPEHVRCNRAAGGRARHSA